MDKLEDKTKVVILDNRRADNLTHNSTLYDFKIGIVVDSREEEGQIIQYKVIDTDGMEHYIYHGKDFVTIDFYKMLLKEVMLKARNVESEAQEIMDTLEYIYGDTNFSLGARARIYEHMKKKHMN